MKHDLKPYPAYKDSGVPWLGDVPEHWETRKLRNILTGISERNRPDLPLLSVVREKGVILRDVTNRDENHNYIPDDLTNYKVVRQGQFAMNKMKAWQGSFGVSQHDSIGATNTTSPARATNTTSPARAARCSIDKDVQGPCRGRPRTTEAEA